MNKPDQLGTTACKGLLHLIRGERLAPFIFKSDDLTTMSCRHLSHPVTEVTAYTDQHLITRFDEIAYTSLHTGGPGGGNGYGQIVLGLKYIFEQGFGFIHDLDKIRIKMSDQRGGHGLINAGVHITWPRSHQDAFTGVQCTISCIHQSAPLNRVIARMHRLWFLQPRHLGSLSGFLKYAQGDRHLIWM